GSVIEAVKIRCYSLRLPIPTNFIDEVKSRIVLNIRRRAKYFLFELDDAQVIIGHLGMSGRMKVYENKTSIPAASKHDHVDFELSNGYVVRYCDPRRFGLLTLSRIGELEKHHLLRTLGPEPLDSSFTVEVLLEQLSGRNISIKRALLEQRTLAGLGNIYVSEILYRSGISPNRMAANVKGGRADKLVEAIKSVLLTAIKAGGSSLRDYKQPSGELGYFQNSFQVYGKQGLACPDCYCDFERTGGIKRVVQNGRSTFYCSRVQG
ncbi:MAG: bifunctional DNA-formamidopyrimidine glycosylase/DNA-(apurinic or apyrimidinic site) lyase, partial [Pseudomonadota bacterium]|nr:bifunctional DNA-formamidopyrimidine glycosylase/DNA-(apurinic or apyrimidinic site) lyase [Pseudomonadota bacterium]